MPLGRQGEPSIGITLPFCCRIRKALRIEWQSSTLRFASTPEGINEIKILNPKFPRAEIELTTCRAYSRTFVPHATTDI